VVYQVRYIERGDKAYVTGFNKSTMLHAEMFEAFIKEHIVDHEHTQRSGLRTGEADAGSNQVEPTQASTQAATEIIRSIEVDIQRGPKV
jgi:hypothetical protein